MKKTILAIIHSICFIIVIPFVLIMKLPGCSNLFYTMGQVYSLIPGEFGRYIRASYYNLTLDKCPLDVEICFGTIFTKRNVEIGHGVYIGGYCNIGMCKIGDNATIASNVCILSGKKQHGYKQVGADTTTGRGVSTDDHW